MWKYLVKIKFDRSQEKEKIKIEFRPEFFYSSADI